MQTEHIPVCNMDLFDENLKHFWISDLNGLLPKFPFLEYPHTHNFYTILFIEQAQGEINIDNKRILVNEAKVIIIKPHCINTININNKANGMIICFHEAFFSLRFNNNILNLFTFLNLESKPFIRISENQLNRLKIFLNLLKEEYILQKTEAKKVIRSYLNILLFELERIYKPVGTINYKTPRQHKVQSFEKLIGLHFISKKLPSDYAELLNISPNYLNKLCKETTGMTAGDLIRKRITIEAQRLILYTHNSINEIADKLGFENTSYFITFFKKQTGNSPEQFRKLEK
ncbi:MULTISPECIES: AraC family transcriptional regulator [Psychroflexus]|uniref:AraC-type DNA-binding protein n=1 Tax=Psychroflexus halocasei TaxID=908615 RepID=A0A1H4BTK0_9FLAO|nr:MULTISPECIES: AraC family transcriptional regulator [Psychroflexus]PJX27600.1 hypothetical protein CAP47_01845 [Psychroflexus sp. S27]SEA51410.1 AraC-type DNA-binding protein [Psychroflexus halocasei]